MPLGKKQENGLVKVILQTSLLTDTYCSARVWNQFQRFGANSVRLSKLNGVCDEKTVPFLFF